MLWDPTPGCCCCNCPGRWSTSISKNIIKTRDPCNLRCNLPDHLDPNTCHTYHYLGSNEQTIIISLLDWLSTFSFSKTDVQRITALYSPLICPRKQKQVTRSLSGFDCTCFRHHCQWHNSVQISDRTHPSRITTKLSWLYTNRDLPCSHLFTQRRSINPSQRLIQPASKLLPVTI
jgi:hypothetical protein